MLGWLAEKLRFAPMVERVNEGDISEEVQLEARAILKEARP